MAFPSVAGTPVGTADTTSAAFTVTLPSGIVAGELLLIFMAQDAVGTISQSSGSAFTRIDTAVNGANCKGEIWARLATGGETNPVFASTNSQDVACVAFRVQDHGVTDLATDIVKGTAATGADAAPNPPNCNPGTAQDFLWIEYFAADDDDDTVPFESANYTGILQLQSASSTTSCLVAVASRQLNASAQDPGVMAMAAVEEWVAQTIAIKPITQKTHTTDSLLKATFDKTHTTDSFIAAGIVVVDILHTTDSLLQSTAEKTHTTDSLLKATLDKAHTTDSLLLATLEKLHTTDSILQATSDKTHTTDSLLEAQQDKTHTTDSLLKATQEKTHSTDSLLEATFEKTHTTDSFIAVGGVDIQHTTDSLLEATLDRTHLTDSLLKATLERAHTTDSLLKATSEKAHTTDSLLKAAIEKTHTTDSLLKATTSKTHTTDSLLAGTIEKTHTTDSLLKATLDKTHLTDSLLKTTSEKTHTTDSYIAGTVEKTHTTDSLLNAASTKTHTTDSFLQPAAGENVNVQVVIADVVKNGTLQAFSLVITDWTLFTDADQDPTCTVYKATGSGPFVIHDTPTITNRPGAAGIYDGQFTPDTIAAGGAPVIYMIAVEVKLGSSQQIWTEVIMAIGPAL